MNNLSLILQTNHLLDDKNKTLAQTIEFNDFCLDSRLVKKHNVFVVTEQNKIHINQAIANGCVAMITEQSNLACSVPVIVVKNLTEHLNQLLLDFYRITDLKAKLIGITGTNGKTSTAHFVAQLLTHTNYKVGILGTLGNGIYQGADKPLEESTLTTLDTVSLYQKLAEFTQNHADFIVMEISSHSLKQKRIRGLVFDLVCFTNLSLDHLDYHGNMDDYFASKCQLFTTYTAPHTKAIINGKDYYGEKLLVHLTTDSSSLSPNNVFLFYYQNNGKYPAKIYSDHPNLLLRKKKHSLTLDLEYQNKSYALTTVNTHPSDIELANILCAFSIVLNLGIPLTQIIRSASQLLPVAGRMQYVSTRHDDVTVIVDYAHTPDALYNVLKNIKQCSHASLKVVCVFGCGGERDQTKRRKMGNIAGQFSDMIYITDDNPRNENPATIRQQIIAGIDSQSKRCEIADRSAAIKHAICQTKKDSIVLIAGKGHEKYQLINEQKIPFDDVVESRNALKLRHEQQLHRFI